MSWREVNEADFFLTISHLSIRKRERLGNIYEKQCNHMLFFAFWLHLDLCDEIQGIKRCRDYQLCNNDLYLKGKVRSYMILLTDKVCSICINSLYSWLYYIVHCSCKRRLARTRNLNLQLPIFTSLIHRRILLIT